MKKLLVLFVVLLATAAFTGCTTLNQSVPSSPMQTTSPSALVPDVEVGGKISGTASIQKILFFQVGKTEYADGVTYAVSNMPQMPMMSMVDKAKATAALQAVTDSNADLIVAPRYEVRSLGVPFLYSEISATVTGYKGTIKGFHQLKDEHLFN